MMNLMIPGDVCPEHILQQYNVGFFHMFDFTQFGIFFLEYKEHTIIE